MLYSSKRNSVLNRSVIWKRFIKLKSQLFKPGPLKTFRPELPNRKLPASWSACKAVTVKQLVSNHSLMVLGPLPKQVRSGRGLLDPEFE